MTLVTLPHSAGPPLRRDDRCPVCLRLHDAMVEAGRRGDGKAGELFRDALVRHRELRHIS
ncbi:hypothetical protein [Streptomyces luteireticuli]|uniref:hypothetical protein n=1 Tax=Streptomyces luteireticuli TaxID=173858 RepID=UPI003556517D